MHTRRQPAEADMLSERLVAAFERYGPAYMRWVATRVPVDGLSPQRLRVLHVLRQRGTMPMRELGAHLGVTGRAVTQLVDALEADGYVERQPHATDRRVSLIALTQTGKRAAAHEHRQHRRAVAELFEHLGAADQRSLLRSIDALNEVLANELGAHLPDPC
jgi:DNA-binding MarR family transcriptional regulator